VRAVLVLLTTGLVMMLDSGWWLAAAIVSGVALFAMAHRAEHRHSPYRKGWS